MSVHLLLAAPAVAQLTEADGYGPGSDRFGSAVAVLLALAGLVLAATALARGRRRASVGDGPAWALGALALSLAGAVVGVVALAGSDGGVGTGNGRGGAVVALVVGLIGTALAGRALARARRVSGRIS